MKPAFWTVLIILILIGIGAFALLKKDETSSEVPPLTITEEEDSVSAGTLLQNATITVPDSDAVVTLKDGEAMFSIEAGSADEGMVTVVDDMSAVWGKKGRTDLAAILAVNSGGTGTFYYLVLFDVSGNTFTKKSEAFLGDRIEVSRVGIGELVNDSNADYRVTVQTLVRGEGEPFTATPTVAKTRTFYVTNQKLEEVEVGRDDS